MDDLDMRFFFEKGRIIRVDTGYVSGVVVIRIEKGD